MVQKWMMKTMMILDLREREGTMTFLNETLTKNLRKAVGEKDALADEVQGM